MKSLNITLAEQVKKAGINRLRNNILTTYKKLGETTESIDVINNLAAGFLSSFKKTKYYENQYQSMISEAVASGDYKRFALIDDSKINMSLHVMPKGNQIPMHAHPKMFCLTLIDQGQLRIKHDSWGRLYPLNNRDTATHSFILSENKVSTGLPIKGNLHQIQAESGVVVFFSLRIKSNVNKPKLGGFLSIKRLAVTGVLIGFVIPFMSLTGAANSIAYGESGYVKNSASDSSKQKLLFKNPQRLASLRNSGQYEKQVEAVQYYQQAALRGDTESQYWLGVMCLEGNGITEDDYLALEWISKAADQNYPPAQKLLAHLLATDFDMDC